MRKFRKSYIRTFIILFLAIAINVQILLSVVSVSEEQYIFVFKVIVLNVILASGLMTVCEMVVHHYTVKKPLRKITEGIGRFMEGRFREKIETIPGIDNTEFDQIINGLNKMADELLYLETIRTDFISNVSHEMKTPLAIIQNYSVLLQSPDLTEEMKKEYTKGIISQTKKMSRMFSNILKLSKLENQKFVPNLETYNLGEQLCECMLMYEEVWENKQMKIETDIEENVIVCLDKELVSQVWLNLISNAVKFTKNGDIISLTLKKEGDEAVVTIRDTGQGMTKEVKKNIFYKFYQGDTSRAMPGNGLGLPLVKSIVKVCHGSIDVESTFGKGSAFTVRLKTKE